MSAFSGKADLAIALDQAGVKLHAKATRLLACRLFLIHSIAVRAAKSTTAV